MKEEIEELESTTFAGRRFTRKQLARIQKTVNTFPKLSRRELGHTICEHLNWTTPSGTDRIQTCLNALEAMETAGLFRLPEKVKQSKKSPQKRIMWTPRTAAQAEIECSLAQLMPICVRKVTQKEDIELWNEFVDRYHYLGYRRPRGTHMRYFIVSKGEDDAKILGCLLFSFPVWSLACRDQWLGWNLDERKKHLHLILNNNRFLIFPWVKVQNLASKVLSLISRQIADDWQAHHGFQPVLLETFIDPRGFNGTCYKAANWQPIGKTAGNTSPPENQQETSQKEVYVYPLDRDYKAILKNEKTPNKPQKPPVSRSANQPSRLAADDTFVVLWQGIIDLMLEVAEEFDQKWQKRKRIINTLLLILFIFRLVFSKNKQGYGITVVELWSQCHTLNIPLPQPKPVAASAFCNARAKLDESIFKTLNTAIIATYETTQTDYQWKKHRLFAVDGTKTNLPRPLRHCGYKPPSENAHYPQGLVSCLYQLKSRIPYDFDLVSHNNERTLAFSHMKVLQQNDVVVYDRGYFSYAMLYCHISKGVEAVFRLQNNSHKAIDEFMDSHATDKIVTIEISTKRQKDILSKYPGIEFIPLKLRLIKYTVAHTTYTLGTTLLDRDTYKAEEFPDLYHARWGVEELYKISKVLIDVEDFHAHSERGVKQELFAHFVLITLNSIFTNHTEEDINKKDCHSPDDEQFSTGPKFKVNVKNSLITIARNLECLFIQQAKLVTNTINKIIDSISFCKQKERPNRTYERKSMKPVKKWRSSKTKQALKPALG